MKITNYPKEEIPFSEIAVGSVFECDGCFFIKIYPINDSADGEINAVILTSGQLDFFGPNDPVTLCEAELRVR